MATERELAIVVSAEDKASSKLKSLGDKIGGIFSKIGIGVGIAGAAIGAMAAKGINDFADIGGAVQDMADRTGLATKNISGLRVAAQLSGTSIETVEAAIKKMEIGMTSAAGVSDNMKAAFNGIDLTVENFMAAKPDFQFQLLARAIGQTQDPAMRAQLAMEAFGKAGTDLLPMFADGNFSLAEFNKQAEQLGVSFSPEKAAQAAALGDAMDKLKMMMSGLSLTVGGFLAPALTYLLDNVITPLAPVVQKLASEAFDLLKIAAGFLIEKVKELYTTLDNAGVIDAFRNAFELVAQAFTESLWPAIQSIWVALQPWLPLLGDLARLFGTVLIGAILFLVTIFAVFVEALGGVMKKVAEFITQITGFLKPGIDGARQGIQDMIDTVKSMVEWFNTAISTIKTLLSKIGDLAKAATGGVLGGIIGKITGGGNKARALGGPVTKGETYMVGENGPEYFTAPSGGSIIPNGRMGGGASVAVYNTLSIGSVSSELDVKRMAKVLGDSILGDLKQQLGI